MDESQTEPHDAGLIRRIRDKTDDPEPAAAAFSVFYSRHIQFVYRCISRASMSLVGRGMDAEDIVEDTFAKVWNGAAHSYNIVPAVPHEKAVAATRAWLCQIARNLVRDELRRDSCLLPVDPQGENEALFTDASRSHDSASCREVYPAVGRALSERDAAIVWFKIRYYNPDTGLSQPPPPELKRFCDEWSITPAALRKAYDRALEELRSALAHTSTSLK